MKYSDELFRDTVIAALDLKEMDYRADLALGEVSSWDSVGHLALVFAVEAAFDVKFQTDSITEMNSLPRLRAALVSAKGT